MRIIIISMGILLTSVFAFASVQVDLAKSRFRWTGQKKYIGDAKHTGLISLKKAQLKTSKKGQVIGGSFVMDLNSINVTDLKGKDKAKFERHIKSDDFFDVKNHPTATLVIDKVSGQTATGKLTIKGKEQPVKVAFTKKGATYTGKFTFDRTKFDVIYGSKTNFVDLAKDKVIDDNIVIEFKVHTKTRVKAKRKKKSA